VLGRVDYLLWFVTALLELSVAVCALARHSFRRYLALNIYMLGSLGVTILRFWVFSHYGFASAEYLYFYYYSEALLTVVLYFALITLYSFVLGELQTGQSIRLAAIVLLAGTAFFSYLVIQQSTDRMLTRFVVELSQNLYFVGLVLTYLLWGAILKLRETRTQLIQLVLSLGLYFSAFAATYALRNLSPNLHMIAQYIGQLIALSLPLAWAYTIWRVSPEARLAPSRLVVVPR
jgi:hypothetical protein